MSAQLKNMLVEATAPSLKKSLPNHSNPRHGPLIEVLHDDALNRSKGKRLDKDNKDKMEHDFQNSVTQVDDDDDSPPPIAFHNSGDHNSKITKAHSSVESSAESRAQTSAFTIANQYCDAQTIQKTITPGKTSGTATQDAENAKTQSTLADEILAEATKAERASSMQKTKEERQKAKKSTFGFQKGFLNSSGNKKSSKTRPKAPSLKNDVVSGIKKSSDEKNDNLIYELDSDGNMVPSSHTTPECVENSQTSSNQPANSSAQDPLLFPEVQEKMADLLKNSSDEWATSDFIESITTNHPKLAAGLTNPKYTAALQSMQTHPKETMDRLKKEHSDVLEFLQEFCGVVGEHFTKLGDTKGKSGDVKINRTKANGGNDSTNSTQKEASPKIREMGPLEKKALEAQRKKQKEKKEADEQPNSKHRKDLHENDAPCGDSAAMDSQVAAILADDELTSILMDPRMQQIMEECTSSGSGQKMHYYLGHEEYGPKLRKLIEAGLLRVV